MEKSEPSSPGKLGRVNYETPTLFEQTMVPDKVISIDDEIKRNELMIQQKMKMNEKSRQGLISESANKIASNTTMLPSNSNLP